MRRRIRFLWGTDGFVGTASAGLYLMVAAFAVGVLAVTGPWADSVTAGNRISAGTTGGACVAAGAALATSRIFVRGGVVHVVSLLRTYLVDTADIVELEDANGFAICLTSGRVSAVANQQSLIAEFTGNRRGRRAARRLTRLCGPFSAQRGRPTGDTVRNQLRWRPIVAAVPITAAFTLYSALAALANPG